MNLVLLLIGGGWVVMALDAYQKKEWEWYRWSVTIACIWFAASSVISALK